MGTQVEKYELNVNGKNITIEVERNRTLLYVLREILDLTGAKHACGTGDCGACTVIMDGEAVRSCIVPIGKAQGKKIETIEGLMRGSELHPIQRAFVECGAIQCGYCTPGMIMSVKALLDRNLDPSDDEIAAALSSNLCRCTGYVGIVKAVRMAAKLLADEKRGVQ
jgi:carbon-monoxide dehydrogenase small subunit